MSELTEQEWLAALRSGGYEQTVGVMKSSVTGGYCCLGVACELDQRITNPEDEDGIFNFDGQIVSAISAAIVVDDSATPWSWMTPDQGFALSQMNDNGSTFTEIADAWEAGL